MTRIFIFSIRNGPGASLAEKSDTALYHPSCRSLRRVAEPLGVVGAIAIECSPWLIDNFWLQDITEQNPIMLGFIGDLEPADPSFAATLDRLHRSPRFLGIRYGNLWNRDLGAAIVNPAFRTGLNLLADAGLVLETANPDPALIAAVVKAC